jgi:hypothetical protein
MPPSLSAARQSQPKPRSGLEDVREAIDVLSVRCTPPQHLASIAARLLDEWTLDLQAFEPQVLIAAVRAYGDTDRGRRGFWPALGEIKALAATLQAAKDAPEPLQIAAEADWADEWPETWGRAKAALGSLRWAAWLAACRWDAETRTLICPNAMTLDQAEWRLGSAIRAFVGAIKFTVRQ